MSVETLDEAERLKNELNALRPLDAEAEARIMQKFRLDWNYHSNNLEGNSLTYGETKALILFGITAQGKPLKDHFEITGHNEAINWILEIVKGETVLTEKFIRELHTLLLKETSYKEAQTADGKPTRRKIEVGKYKTLPNHVVTVTGETFYFAAPEETPAKMHELIEWFRSEKEKPEVNPIILAALFHYRFIRIHPFDDGNGRVARILMNFILMQFGYPPAIIKTEDKENYYAVLRLADADELEPFIKYITENLIRSLEIMIKGAKGESIEEPDDLDKELDLLERRIKTFGQSLKVDRNFETIANVFALSIKPLLERIKETCEKFDRFYVSNKMNLEIDGRRSEFVKNQSFYSINDDIWFYQNTENIIFEYLHSTLKQPLLKSNYYVSQVKVIFELTKFLIEVNLERSNVETLLIEKEYSELLTKPKIEEIVKYIAQEHKKFIETKINTVQDIYPLTD
jgi:Fic family protein